VWFTVRFTVGVYSPPPLNNGQPALWRLFTLNAYLLYGENGNCCPQQSSEFVGYRYIGGELVAIEALQFISVLHSMSSVLQDTSPISIDGRLLAYYCLQESPLLAPFQ
jgi:hypothetical protein